MQTTQIVAFSSERYNGGIAVKRKYGSSTVTVFTVHRHGETADKWKQITAYGASPGERKTYAIEQYKRLYGAA